MVPCSPWHGITHSAESSKVRGGLAIALSVLSTLDWRKRCMWLSSSMLRALDIIIYGESLSVRLFSNRRAFKRRPASRPRYSPLFLGKYLVPPPTPPTASSPFFAAVSPCRPCSVFGSCLDIFSVRIGGTHRYYSYLCPTPGHASPSGGDLIIQPGFPSTDVPFPPGPVTCFADDLEGDQPRQHII